MSQESVNKSSTRESFLPPLWIITLLGTALILWIVYQLKEIVVLLVLGFAIAYIFDPILILLQRKKISRPVGFIAVLGVLIIFLWIALQTAVPTVVEEYEKLSDNFPSYVSLAKEKVLPIYNKFKFYLPRELRLDKTVAVVPAQGGAAIPAPVIPGVTGMIDSVLSGFLNALLKGYSITLTLVNLALLPFIAFYVAVDLEKIYNSFILLFPRRKRTNIRAFFSEINTDVSAFIRGQLLVCAILFCLYAIGLGIVGIDLWFLMAVIAGFGNIIPYFGFLTGIVLSTMMAIVTFGDFAHVMQIWLVFGIVQCLESFVITPKVIGESVGLSPLVIILAIFAGGQLFGLLGVFLAVPGAAVLRVSGRRLHSWILKKSEA